jgi:hypothetical protein
MFAPLAPRPLLSSAATVPRVRSIRQSDVTKEVELIGAIERKIGRVVMVLDPWDKPIALTRVWCARARAPSVADTSRAAALAIS